MNLSFIEELQVNLSDFITGINRFQRIDKLLYENVNWRKEVHEHFKNLLAYMIHHNASDIDLGGPGTRGKIWYRIYGNKSPCDDMPSYNEDEITLILLNVLNETQKKILYEKKNIDFSMEMVFDGQDKPNRFRGDIYFDRNYLSANFRKIDQKVRHIKSLNFPENIIKRLNLYYEKSGLYLITGISGSGKSTTLDSIVDMNNHTNKAHIVIIGDPIEFIHRSDKCIVKHRNVGDDVLSFEDGTVQALRQDPDIIIVGEMRDPQTIATVIEVTDSGHKVFTTLHTSSAIDSIHRIIGEFPPNEQDRIRMRLADTIRVCISQKLIPDKKGKVVMTKEILSVDSSVKAAIRNKNIGEIYQMMVEGKKKGMMTLEQDLLNLYRKNVISKETALNYANNRKIMIQLLQF